MTNFGCEDLTQAVEDYLKAIYELTQNKEVTGTSEIAEKLSVSPASVTSMLKKLADHRPSLVYYQKSRGVQLSSIGKQCALRKIRQHRLVELFLVEILDYSWDEIHPEAEILEHVISPRLEEQIAKVLGNPEFDPHGDPIPRSDLSLPEDKTIQLKDLKPEQKGIVRRVRSSDSGLLRYLGEIGLKPAAVVTMVSIIPFDQTIHLLVEGKTDECVLGEEIGNIVGVEITD